MGSASLKTFLRLVLPALAALILACPALRLTPAKLPQEINDLSAKYLYSFSGKSAKPYNLVGVAIDDYSISSISQRWPWRRTAYARLIDVLSKEQASVIGIDLVFIGDSEDKNDDLALEKALKDSSSRVVLACTFDSKKGAAVMPQKEFTLAAYLTGLLNTPADSDGKVRRLRAYIDVDNARYYSFSLALAAAYLGKDPAQIASGLALTKEKSFFVKYLFKPEDTVVVSAFDVLENIDGLKKRYGQDFLKSALVLVYPTATILRDSYMTPLGRLAGGFLHLNGAANMLLGLHTRDVPAIDFIFLSVMLAAIGFILLFFGLFFGLALATGALVAIFWCSVLLGMWGVRLDLAYIFNASVLFYILGSIYKYSEFLLQLIKIREKVTIDPLSNLFSPRYFCYRVALETKNLYLGKRPFVLVFDLRLLEKNSEKMDLEQVRGIWRDIGRELNSAGGLWSAYGKDAIAGCLVRKPRAVSAELNTLRENIIEALKAHGLNLELKIAVAALNKNFPVKKLLSLLSEKLQKQKEAVAVLNEGDIAPYLNTDLPGHSDSGKLLENIDRDIEEKNRQLLSYIEELKTEHAKTKEAYFQTIGSLVKALEAKDTYTEGHSERVSRYALLIAGKLNWPEEEMELLRKAALLHDLGKIGMPDSILHKQGRLTEEEFNVVRMHEIVGVKILEPLKEFKEILPWILHHHERWDGKGYPHGLGGNNIPMAAQIISLADVFDALTTGRDYKKAFPVEEARQEILNSRGTQFNPALVDIFMEIIKEKIE
jgi:putative nucleotidyltransferase with HDIG domain